MKLTRTRLLRCLVRLRALPPPKLFRYVQHSCPLVFLLRCLFKPTLPVTPTSLVIESQTQILPIANIERLADRIPYQILPIQSVWPSHFYHKYRHDRTFCALKPLSFWFQPSRLPHGPSQDEELASWHSLARLVLRDCQRFGVENSEWNGILIPF